MTILYILKTLKLESTHYATLTCEVQLLSTRILDIFLSK